MVELMMVYLGCTQTAQTRYSIHTPVKAVIGYMRVPVSHFICNEVQNYSKEEYRRQTASEQERESWVVDR
jgi:hypothetical protein